jgi:hypothetical protein
MWWLWPALLVAMFYALSQFGEIIQRITSDFPVEKRLFYSSLGLGVIFGVVLCVIAAQTGIIIRHWIDARQGFRTERLMLKYHDELMEKEASNQASQQKRC